MFLFAKPSFSMQRIVFSSFPLLGSGFQIVATRSLVPDPSYQILTTRSWFPDPGYY